MTRVLRETVHVTTLKRLKLTDGSCVAVQLLSEPDSLRDDDLLLKVLCGARTDWQHL